MTLFQRCLKVQKEVEASTGYSFREELTEERIVELLRIILTGRAKTRRSNRDLRREVSELKRTLKEARGSELPEGWEPGTPLK